MEVSSLRPTVDEVYAGEIGIHQLDQPGLTSITLEPSDMTMTSINSAPR
jgi:hypothetical protein